MPPYHRGGEESRGASAGSSGLRTTRNSEFVILRSPENITDVDPDTEDEWDREYRPRVKKTGKPPKKVTRSVGLADDVESVVDLEDYSPRGPSRKRKEVKVGLKSNPSTVGDKVSYDQSAMSSGDRGGPSEDDSEDDDAPPPPIKPSKIAGRSRANKEAEKARTKAGTIVCASSTSRKSATQEIKSAQQKKYRQTASYEAKTAERVAEIAAGRAPHLVALARINAEAEQLREQLRLKKQEREIMERVWGVVRSREKGKIGLERKTEKPKTAAWVIDSGDEDPLEISSSSEVGRQMSLLRQELQEESEGWNSLFDESEKMSGADSIKVDKPTMPQSKKRVSGKWQEASEEGEKSQNPDEKRKSWAEENTDREIAEQTGCGGRARFPASDSDSLLGYSKEMPVQGRRGQISETKRAPYWSKISQQEKKGLSDSQPIHEGERRQAHGQKRKHRLEARTDAGVAGQKGSQKTLGFPVSDSDLLSDDSETYPEQGGRKKFKKDTEVLQEGPRKGFGIHSGGTLIDKKSLGLHDEKVIGGKEVECGKGGGVKKGSNHLSNYRRLREKSIQEEVGGGSGSSVQDAQEDLIAKRDLERLGRKQSGGGAEYELERINEEIDLLLGECAVHSTSRHDHQKSPEGYDVELFDPLPEMLWGNLVGASGGGGSSTMAEHAVTNSMHTGPGAPERELQLAQKQLEKDLDLMDWDGAEAEFLKFDDANLGPVVEDQKKKDVELGGMEGQGGDMGNRAPPLQQQPSSQKSFLSPHIPEESTRGKVLADLQEEKMGHRLDGPEDEKNNRSEEDDRAKIYSPAPVHNLRRNYLERARARPYSMKEIAEYSIASLFQTYKKEIERMEVSAIKPMESSAARRGDGGMGVGRMPQANGVEDTSAGEPKARIPPALHHDKSCDPKAENRRIYTLSEWREKRGREEGLRDVTPASLGSGEIAGKEAGGKIADATASSLKLASERKGSTGLAGVDISSPENGEIVEPEQKGSDPTSLNIYLAEISDNPMRPLGAGSDKGSLLGAVPGPDSAVSPGETAKLYRVELPDSSMGYVLAKMVCGTWSMVFMTDTPGDRCEKTQRSTPQLDSDGGFLSGAGETACQSAKRPPRSVSRERTRLEFPETWGQGCKGKGDERDFGPAGIQSQSPAPKRAFQESNRGEVEEREQQKQEHKRQALDTRDGHEDFNDWD